MLSDRTVEFLLIYSIDCLLHLLWACLVLSACLQSQEQPRRLDKQGQHFQLWHLRHKKELSGSLEPSPVQAEPPQVSQPFLMEDNLQALRACPSTHSSSSNNKPCLVYRDMTVKWHFTRPDPTSNYLVLQLDGNYLVFQCSSWKVDSNNSLNRSQFTGGGIWSQGAAQGCEALWSGISGLSENSKSLSNMATCSSKKQRAKSYSCHILIDRAKSSPKVNIAFWSVLKYFSQPQTVKHFLWEAELLETWLKSSCLWVILPLYPVCCHKNLSQLGRWQHVSPKLVSILTNFHGSSYLRPNVYISPKPK